MRINALIAPSLAGNRGRHEIDDEIGLLVAQDEMAVDEPVLETFRQRRQRLQHVRRHGAERQISRIAGVDLELERAGPSSQMLPRVFLPFTPTISGASNRRIRS